ncbi:kielin chordin [Paramuricea clavata]|uniref:Kielin chordin n=1 Tax=Paramuricea clavata TaxID=317549 RepID=A0A7D9DUT7_PARCT|nr:kielin chordin [Paramuricea clavata]
MNRVTVILFHGVLLMFVHELVLANASQQVDEGNYIVPRTTLELSSNKNKSADGHKKICMNNLDCEMYTNNQCCPTISGYFKCRKRCRPKKRLGKFRSGKKGRSRNNKHKKKKTFSFLTDGCTVGHNKVYKEGEVVQAKDGCNDCKCQKGKMICTKRHCPPGKCAYKNALYNDGYRLVLHNGCKRCICQYTSWNCTSHPCVEEVVKQPTSTASILQSALLALICSVMHFLLLT